MVDLIFGCSTIPDGSNLVKTNLSTNSSNGTPYCKPIEIEIAKQFIMLRMVAPSFAISINISPNVPSPYSPVRKKIACPLIFAFCVKPRRLAGNDRAFNDTGQLSFQFGIRRSLYSFLHFFQQFFNGQFTQINNV